MSSPPRRCGARRRVAAWALLAAAALPAASASNKVFDRTGVVEVLLPVQVVDRHGQPVRGLAPEDFEILDGRKTRPVAGFQTIDLDLLEPDPGRFWDDGSVPAAGRRHFLLIFDLTFSRPSTLLQARQMARRFVLEDLHPTDLVAVGTHSVDRGARVLRAFTADRGQAARAIDAVGGPRQATAPGDDPLAMKLNPVEQESVEPGAGPPGDIRSDTFSRDRTNDLSYWVLDQERSKSEEALSAGRISSWAASLAELGEMLDSLKGKKHLLYFSEGFDGQLLFGRELSALEPGNGEEARNLLMQRHWSMHTDDRYGDASRLADVDEMIDSLRRADCVLHAVDISGLRGQDGGGERSRQGRRHTLFYITRESGGELISDTNELRESLGGLLERTALTYLLTFRIDDVPADGSYHSLKVRARLPDGGRVATRSGYRAPLPLPDLHPLERDLLTSQAIASGGSVDDVALEVVAAAFPAGPGSAYVPVVVEVSGASLLAGQKSPRVPVELYVYVTDPQGEIRDFFSEIVSLDVGRDRRRFEERGVKFYGDLDLRPGDYLVRVLVRHGDSGRFGLETRRLAVPDFHPSGPVLLPPFFLDGAGDGWVLVREKAEEGTGDAVVYPFTLSGVPFIPAARPHLDPNASVRLCLVAYHLGAGEIEVHATVLDEQGARVATEPELAVERTVTGIRGLDKLAATFAPRGLEAGDYLLQVAVTDPASGWTEVATAPFAIGD
ncbi:MAG: VWA domain-containing protein [Thermoanaerobaculia bacterium]|nr:VWA domain-containing protein [Thermoanaerobaculia bacterium]